MSAAARAATTVTATTVTATTGTATTGTATMLPVGFVAPVLVAVVPVTPGEWFNTGRAQRVNEFLVERRATAT